MAYDIEARSINKSTIELVVHVVVGLVTDKFTVNHKLGLLDCFI